MLPILGAAVGAGANLATSDNYSSTAAFRNGLIGGMVGGGIGLGAGVALSEYGRFAMRTAAWPVTKRLAKQVWGTGKLAGKGLGAPGKFMYKHPRLSMAAGVLGGGALLYNSMNSGYQQDPNAEAMETSGPGYGRQDFQNSAQGISFGLWHKRHR